MSSRRSGAQNPTIGALECRKSARRPASSRRTCRSGSVAASPIKTAWDAAAFVDSHPRPQDPRFTGNLDETRRKFHDDDDYYGKMVGGVLLGAPQTTPQ